LEVRKVAQPVINYAPETCAWCGGTGRHREGGVYYGMCRVCGGKGSVLVAQPAKKCAWCGGTGRHREGGVYYGMCRVCGGTGWAHALRPTKQK